MYIRHEVYFANLEIREGKALTKWKHHILRQTMKLYRNITVQPHSLHCLIPATMWLLRAKESNNTCVERTFWIHSLKKLFLDSEPEVKRSHWRHSFFQVLSRLAFVSLKFV